VISAEGAGLWIGEITAEVDVLDRNLAATVKMVAEGVDGGGGVA